MVKFTIGFHDSYSRIEDMKEFTDFNHKIERKFKTKKNEISKSPVFASAAIHFEIIAEEFYFDINEGSADYGFRGTMTDQTFPGYIHIKDRVENNAPHNLHKSDYIIHFEGVKSILLDSKKITLDDFIENPNIKNHILNYDIVKNQIKDGYVHIQIRNKDSWIKIHDDDRFDDMYDYKDFVDKDPRYR